MEQPIIGYHKDKEEHWVAELECGHHQHVRHNPPWQLRPWLLKSEGRKKHIGYQLDCKKCDRAEPEDVEL